jgi:hypothetical protein
MGVITLTFTAQLNESLQIGDTVYYTPISTVGSGANAFSTGGTIVEIGTVVTIPSRFVLTCNIDDNTARPGSNDFILFSKDNQANMASMLGYYAEVKLSNNSTDHAELFAVGSEFSESSK